MVTMDLFLCALHGIHLALTGIREIQILSNMEPKSCRKLNAFKFVQLSGYQMEEEVQMEPGSGSNQRQITFLQILRMKKV